MFAGFERIVEERIREAQRKGELDNLPGSGKPIVFEDDRFVPEELKLAYKVLKNAGFLPPEIELKKEIRRAEDLLAGTKEAAGKYRILKRLNFMIMRFNQMRDIAIQSELPQHYLEKLVGRLGETSRRSTPKRPIGSDSGGG